MGRHTPRRSDGSVPRPAPPASLAFPSRCVFGIESGPCLLCRFIRQVNGERGDDGDSPPALFVPRDVPQAGGRVYLALEGGVEERQAEGTRGRRYEKAKAISKSDNMN